jgi:hypothetical protein
MVLPHRQLPSGLVIKNLRPVLKSAGPADAAGAFIIFVTSPEILVFFELAPNYWSRSDGYSQSAIATERFVWALR